MSHVSEWDLAAVAFSCGDGGVQLERLCTGKHQPTLTPLSTQGRERTAGTHVCLVVFYELYSLAGGGNSSGTDTFRHI